MLHINTTGFLNPEYYRITKSGLLPDQQIQKGHGSSHPGNYRIHKSGKVPDPQIRKSTGFCDLECEITFTETTIHEKNGYQSPEHMNVLTFMNERWMRFGRRSRDSMCVAPLKKTLCYRRRRCPTHKWQPF